MDKNKLIKTIKDLEGGITSLGVKSLSLFGSYSKGTNTKESDIDLLVEFKQGMKSYSNLVALHILLEQKLSNQKIELVTPRSLSPYMKDEILSTLENVITAS